MLANMSDQNTILVIGAGLAGLTCARKLAEAGLSVTVLDKGRRPGGRLSTRSSRRGPVFDQGAQYLTARSVTFQQQVRAWVEAGVVAEWTGRFVDLKVGQRPTDTAREAQRYVGLPGMGSLIEHLAEPAERIDGPHYGVRVTRLIRGEAGWTAADDAGGEHGPFGRVVVAIPAPQARELLAEPAADVAARLAEVEAGPTWTLMLAFAESLALPESFVSAFVEGGALSSVSNNTAKPGRPGVSKSGECWAAHTSLEWSVAHLEDEPAEVAAMLTAAFSGVIDRPLPEPVYAAVHRWRYGHMVTPLADRWLLSDDGTVGYCGDGCTQGSPANIERAWLSGLGLAEQLAGRGR